MSYTLSPHGAGTRLVFEHTGFTGISGLILAKVMMRPGWRKMLAASVSAVLRNLEESGDLRATRKLTPRFPPASPP